MLRLHGHRVLVAVIVVAAGVIAPSGPQPAAAAPLPASARVCSASRAFVVDPAPATDVLGAECTITTTSPGTLYLTASATQRGAGLSATSTVNGKLAIDNVTVASQREGDINAFADEFIGQVMYSQGARTVAPGAHRIQFVYSLVAGSGTVYLQGLELNAIFVPDSDADLLACRFTPTQVLEVQTNQFTPVGIGSCAIQAPGPGTMVIVGSTWVRSNAGLANEGYFQAAFDSVIDDRSTRWVNINPTISMTDRSVMVQSAKHVEAGPHSATMYAGRWAGPGNTTFLTPNVHAFFIPDASADVKLCVAPPQDLVTTSGQFVKSVECSLTTPRTSRVLTFSSGSVSTGAGGDDFIAQFGLGVDGQVALTPRTDVASYDDGLDGFDSMMGIVSSARLAAGTHAFQLYGRNAVSTTTVRVFNAQLFAIAFIEPPDFVPLVPNRVLETRPPTVGYVGSKPIAGQTLEVTMAGDAGGTVTSEVPADAKAVAFNLTGTGADAAGFVTAWPCGTPPPTASNLNLAAGGTAPNAVISQVGALGRVCLFTQNGAHLIADVNGYMPSWSNYVATVPDRVLETRPDGRIGYIGGKPEAGQIVELDVTRVGTSMVPDDAIAVTLNVTGTDATADGFVTIWPCGTPRPTASNLNLAVGAIAPNLVISKIGDGGKVCIYTQNGAHLIADVNGYLPALANYQPLVPARLLETRPDGQVGYTGPKPATGATIELQVTGGLVPSSASAVVLNLTGTDAGVDGFVTVFPCGVPRPTASNLNLVAGATSPNLVISKIGDGGKVCIYTQNGAHLIADVNGYWL